MFGLLRAICAMELLLFYIRISAALFPTHLTPGMCVWTVVLMSNFKMENFLIYID